ncbi:hypothetical protein [Flavobacterium zhairuonense]|nr:hypothetical protein [Flavobacterium zhairuonense]
MKVRIINTNDRNKIISIENKTTYGICDFNTTDSPLVNNPII